VWPGLFAHCCCLSRFQFSVAHSFHCRPCQPHRPSCFSILYLLCDPGPCWALHLQPTSARACWTCSTVSSSELLEEVLWLLVACCETVRRFLTFVSWVPQHQRWTCVFEGSWFLTPKTPSGSPPNMENPIPTFNLLWGKSWAASCPRGLPTSAMLCGTLCSTHARPSPPASTHMPSIQ